MVFLFTNQYVRRPSLTNFLNWIREKANVAFWSSVMPKNLDPVLEVVLEGASFSTADVLTLSQGSCFKSQYRAPTAPNKPFFLKDLLTFAIMAQLSSLDYILLIDDSPIKNLLNDKHSAVFPPTFLRDLKDSYLAEHLMPWLDGLFKSTEAMPKYIKNHALFGGQSPVDRMSSLGDLILNGNTPE